MDFLQTSINLFFITNSTINLWIDSGIETLMDIIYFADQCVLYAIDMQSYLAEIHQLNPVTQLVVDVRYLWVYW